MTITRRTVVRFETRKRAVVWAQGGGVLAWCARCGAEVLMVTPDEAAALTETSARAIFRRVESGELHFVETDKGALLICRNLL